MKRGIFFPLLNCNKNMNPKTKKKTDDGHFHHDYPYIKPPVLISPLWVPVNNESVMKLGLEKHFSLNNSYFKIQASRKISWTNLLLWRAEQAERIVLFYIF